MIKLILSTVNIGASIKPRGVLLWYRIVAAPAAKHMTTQTSAIATGFINFLSLERRPLLAISLFYYFILDNSIYSHTWEWLDWSGL